MDAVTLGLGQLFTKKRTRYRTRRAAFHTGMPTTSVSVGTETEAQIRVLLKVPVTSTRWRLHVRNWQPRNGTVYTGAISFTGLWIGQANFTGPSTSALAGRPDGTFTATPVQALTAFTTLSDGSAYVSSWVTDPTAQLVDGRSHLLSYGFTRAAGSNAKGQGTYCFLTATAGTSAAASCSATAAPSGMAQTDQRSYFDFWIEYEWTGSERTGFALGDSLTAGVGQGSSSNYFPPIVQGNDPTQNWPHQLALLTNSPISVAGIAGATAAEYAASSTLGVYTDYPFLATDPPDFAVVFIGSNDISGSQIVASINQYVYSIVQYLRALGIPRIYFLTVPPRVQLGGTGGATPVGNGKLTSAAAIGATSIVTDFFIPTNTRLSIGFAGANVEQPTTSADSTGSGPYTTTLTAALTVAHAVGDTVFHFTEANRRAFNAFLRRKPYGIDGVISIDRVLSDPLNSFALNPEWAVSDNVHLTAGGHAIIAEHVAPIVGAALRA